MPAEKQIEAVSKKLVELNPGFDGKLYHFVDGGRAQGVPKIENGVVTEMHFDADKVTDLSPVRAFSGLKVLSAFSRSYSSELTDISPLQGMPLTALLITGHSKLSNISSLKGMPLTTLDIYGCRGVSDISPLKDMKLEVLACGASSITDLTALVGMPLKTFQFQHNFNAERDAAILRSIKTLETINLKPAAEFWKEVEEQQKKGK